jgi:hypothetical protein
MSKRSWSIRLWIFLGTTGALIVGLLLFRWPGALCLLPGVGAFIVMTRYHHKIACLYALHLLACLLRFLSCNSSG